MKKAIAFLAIAMAVAFVATVGMASADTEVPLYAGQDILVGTVTVSTVSAGDTSITITYATTGDWVLNATHLHVAAVLEDIPQTKKHNPIPGQFMCSTVHDPPVTGNTSSCTISTETPTLYIAAQAEVALLEEGVYVQEESAWAGTDGEIQFNDGKNWATYFVVTVEEAP